MIMDMAAVGLRNLPIPVSPLRPAEVEHIDLKAEPTATVKPVQAVSETRGFLDRPKRTFEQSLPLSAGTRKVLLQYQEDHPLNGPHPTD